MTSANISEALFFTQPTVNLTEQPVSSDGQFKDVLAKQTETAQSTEKVDKGQKAEPSVAKTEYEKTSYSVEKVSVAKNREQGQKDIEELEEDLKELGQQIMAFMAEVFGVTPQELEAFADSQGIETVELTDSAVLSEFVRGFTQLENPMELLTNEQAYQDFKEVIHFAEAGLEEVSQQYQLPAEELKAYLAQNNNTQEITTMATEVSAQLPASGEVTEKEAFAAKANRPVNLELTEENHEDGQTQGIREEDTSRVESIHNNPGNEASGEQHSSFENEKSSTSWGTTKHSQTGRTRTESGHAEVAHADGKVPFASFDKALFSTQFAEGNFETRIRTEDIMRQIMDYMKVTVKPETSDLEMQLHPQSLGNVQIHIANKDGAITAQFATENEAVKATLEGQMIQLKERFEEQGIKVENIEVTVETHSFDQNSGQNQGREEEGFLGQERKTARSLLQASLSEDELELLSDEDKLKLRMMEESGNQVDYKV